MINKIIKHQKFEQNKHLSINIISHHQHHIINITSSTSHCQHHIITAYHHDLSKKFIKTIIKTPQSKKHNNINQSIIRKNKFYFKLTNFHITSELLFIKIWKSSFFFQHRHELGDKFRKKIFSNSGEIFFIRKNNRTSTAIAATTKKKKFMNKSKKKKKTTAEIWFSTLKISPEKTGSKKIIRESKFAIFFSWNSQFLSIVRRKIRTIVNVFSLNFSNSGWSFHF